MKKKNILKLALSLFLITTISNAQSWQWGISGGSFDDDNTNDETVKSIATDSDGNVYSLSNVGVNGLQVAGVSKEGYSGIDYMISSFSCSGEYRWSRVIGSGGKDEMQRIQIDSEDNIYAIGKLRRKNTPAFFGGEIGYDIMLPYSSSSVNLNQQNIFIVKYSSEGELLWMKMPQPEDISYTDALVNSKSLDFQVDADGNSFWLCLIPPGAYADGAFVNTLEGNNLFIFRYDTDGNFIAASELGMQPLENPTLYSIPDMQLVLDSNSNHFYILSNKTNTSTVDMDINGEVVNDNSFLVAFDETGNFLWRQANISTAGPLDFVIDEQGSLYLAGVTRDDCGYAGQIFNIETNHAMPFIMKLSSDGDYIWKTNPNITSAANQAYGITINGNEIAITGDHASMQWANQSLSVETNEGYNVLFARFNKNDGSLIELNSLESNFGYWDYGNAITADIYGNYYVGGRFDNLLYIGDTTLADGAQGRDFFIAKYGTDNCDCIMPQPSFEVISDTQNGNIFLFNYTGTTPYDTISWNFGDGQTSEEENPQYSYSNPGTYNVCLTVTSTCGNEAYCTEVETTSLSTEIFENTLATVYPNPVNDVINIITKKALSYTIYTVLGSEISKGNIDSGNATLYFGSLTPGVYFLHISDENNTSEVIKLFKK